MLNDYKTRNGRIIVNVKIEDMRIIPRVGAAFIVNESNSISVDDVNANADYDAYGTDRRENDDNNEINDNIVEMMIEVCSAILWNNMSSNMI